MDISVTQEGPVAVIRWNEGENRVNVDSMGRINEILDELETIEGPLSLVLTGTGKFFSNGLDLERFGTDFAQMSLTIEQMNRTIGRLLVYPAYTISCAFDYRVMREDRGFWCMNEAEIGLPLNEQLYSILANRLPRATAVKAATTAFRFNGPDALNHGIVESLASEGELLEHAIGAASKYANLDRKILGGHKRLVHGDEAKKLGFDF